MHNLLIHWKLYHMMQWSLITSNWIVDTACQYLALIMWPARLQSSESGWNWRISSYSISSYKPPEYKQPINYLQYLQDFSCKNNLIKILSVPTCEEDCIVHGGHPHTNHGSGQEASSQAPGAGPRDQQLSGVQIITIIVLASSDQENLSWILCYH